MCSHAIDLEVNPVKNEYSEYKTLNFPMLITKTASYFSFFIKLISRNNLNRKPERLIIFITL